MAVRFSTSFRNKLDVLYNIHIHDTEYVNYVPKYGLLYNWYAATDERNITSAGDFVVAEQSDWETLLTYIEPGVDFVENTVGDKLRETGVEHWDSPNLAATNEFNLSLRGSGYRDQNGNFYTLKSEFHSVSLTEYDVDYTIAASINITESRLSVSLADRKQGSVIILVRPATLGEQSQGDGTSCTNYIGNDGKIYSTVKIGTQVWTADNLCETQYRNGDYIPGFDGGVYTPISNETWAAATTAMCCAYDNDIDNAYTEIEGTPVNYIAADEGFEMSQNGDDQYLYNPIIATDVSLFMHVQDSNRAAINTFLFDIVNSGDENRFTVVIYKDSLVYFRGKVHSERISIPDRHHNTITITASDGFGRLRTIPYNDSGTLYEGWETVQNHLYNVLSKLDLFGYGGYLVNSIAVATKLNVAGETSRLFENIRFQHDAVKEIKSDGTIFPLSCHDVLSQILIRFGCRIVQLNGVFHIQEFTSMAESSDISVHNYDSSGNWVSTGDLSYKISTIQKLAGGMTWFREPAKYVKVDYVYQDSLNGSNLAKEIIPFKTWVSVGEVPTGNGETVAVNFDFSVVHKANAFPTSVIYYITYKFSIRRGLSFLTNEGGTAVWQSDSSKTYNVTDLYEIDDPNDINLIHQISFIIPELPSTGDLYIYWNFSKTRSNGAALVTEPNGMDWITVLDNVLAMLYSDNLDANEGTLSTIALGSSSSGEEIDLGAVVIGDMPFERSIGRIQYYKFPSLWLNSLNDWGHDAEEELTLNQLISREILALQRKTTKIKSYIIRSKYPGAGFRLDGNVVTRATYKADSAIWEIESFEPVIDRSSVEYTQYVESDQTGSLPSGISIPTQTTTPNYWDRENNTLTTVNNGDKVEVTVTGGSNTAISGYSEYVGVYGEGDSAGVNGSGTIWGVVGEGNTGLYGEGEAYGVNGYSYEGVGVYAQSDNGTGLIGDSLTGDGISASSTGGVGLKAVGGTYDIETLTSGSVSIKSAGRVSGQDAIADNEFTTKSQVEALIPSAGITSITLAVPAQFTVTGSPLTSNGTLTINQSQQLANRVFAGPTSGSGQIPAFRALVAADIPTLNYDKYESLKAGTTANFKDIVGKNGSYTSGTNNRNLLFKAGNGITLSVADNNTYEAQEITITADGPAISNDIAQIYLSSEFTVIKDAWRVVLTSSTITDPGTYYAVFHVTISKGSTISNTIGAKLVAEDTTIASVEHTSLEGNSQFSLSASGYFVIGSGGEATVTLQIYSIGNDCAARPITPQTSAARATQITLIKIK